MEGTKTAGESALDLVRRIKTTSLRSSSKLDEHLPINAGSCTYIKGKASSGKTELCLQYVLSCVLPETWGPIPLDGSASFALWFDLDVKLSMQRVLELISQRVQERVNEFISTNPSLDTQQLGDFSMLMEETLSRFWICKCPSQLQFEATLHAIAHSNAYDNAKLIVIDSLDCFYWQDRFSSFSFRRDFQSKPFHRAMKQIETIKKTRSGSTSFLIPVSDRYQNTAFDVVAELEEGVLKYHDRVIPVQVLQRGFSVLLDHVPTTL